MDIGDPSEIPTTRRRLPSMQELGAFDFGAPGESGAAADSQPAPWPGEVPVRRPSNETRTNLPGGTTTLEAAVAPTAPAPPPSATTPPSAAAAATTATGAAPGPRPALTAEQLRQALAKADPGTRQKLLRLIAGGRTVQQLPGAAPAASAKPRSLVMQLDPPLPKAAPAPAPAPAPARPPSSAPRTEAAGPASGFAEFSTSRSGARGAAGASPGFTPARGTGSRFAGRVSRPGEQPLMQIDAHTDLLDAAPPAASPAARKAELQAQLDQVPRQAMGSTDNARSEPMAHKVLFPAYDPARHGEDVHGQARRRHEGPIEGHFPAPRQPFKPHYQHPDGRPMTAEESQVEEVLQTQRCEETLGVLARDGVNGLLLSPRDLDAAVANGVISAEAAATLWKTWAALRPVIHVIEDEPPAPADTDASDDDGGTEPRATAAPGDTGEATGDLPLSAMDTSGRGPGPGPGREPPTPTPTPTPTPPVPQLSEPSAAGAGQSPPSVVPTSSPAALASLAADAQAVEPPTLPLPGRQRPTTPNAEPIEPTAVTPAAMPAAPRWPRLKARLKTLAWWFVAYCVLVTSSRLAMEAWLRWGHWISGWPGR
jgi:hypothetical protein